VSIFFRSMGIFAPDPPRPQTMWCVALAALCGAIVGIATCWAVVPHSSETVLAVTAAPTASLRPVIRQLRPTGTIQLTATMRLSRSSVVDQPVDSAATGIFAFTHGALSLLLAGTAALLYTLSRHISNRTVRSSSNERLFAALSVAGAPTTTDVPRADDVLPENLMDAIESASRATAAAFNAGCRRCVAEVLVDGFWDPVSGPVFNDDGDNERWWELNRRYIDTLIAAGRFDKTHVFMPDMGVVAMLTRRWPDAKFTMASVESRGSRDAVPAGTELIVFAAADPTCAEGLQQLVNSLEGSECVALFNPRLASGDVGIGYNVRRLREDFLSRFVTTYSIRPLTGVGAIFKSFPAKWKLFVNDPDAEGRYRLVNESEDAPAGDELDLLLRDALAPKDAQGNVVEPTFGEQVLRTINSLTGFMKRL